MRKDDIGSSVTALQRQLNTAGFKLPTSGLFDAATEAAVIAFQKRAGLVVDGVAGQKTRAALAGFANPKLLSEADLMKAAERLGVSLAALKAVNQVESNGHGFLPDGRPVILYERHIAYRLLKERDRDPDAIEDRFTNLVCQKRGGYTGGTGEWARLSSARQILFDTPGIPEESCSWGQFQIMGYHWQAIGYASIDAFVTEMEASEGAQLLAFIRFIEADPALHKALKSRKWPEFARLYNGPAYKENLYDVKLARAFERFSSTAEPVPE